MKETWGLLAITFVLMAVFCVLYRETKEREGFPKPVSTAFKTAATLCAAYFAMAGALRSGQTAHWLIYAGLLTGAAADFALRYDRVFGGILFAAGHLLYCAAFCVLKAPGAENIVCAAILCAGTVCLFVIFYKIIRREGGKKGSVLLLLYALLEVITVSLACTLHPVTICGTALFALSDILLAYRVAADERNRGFGYIALGTYYIAQLLIACTTVCAV